MKKRIKTLIQKLKNFLSSLFAIYEIISDPGMCRVPFQKKIFMNVKGFVGDRYMIYNIQENDINEYISEYEVSLSKRINQQYCHLMDDKLLFSGLFGHYVNVPKVYGVIHRGILRNLRRSKYAFTDFLTLLQVERTLIIKPIDGGGGENIHTISTSEMRADKDHQERIDSLFLDNHIISEKNLLVFLQNLDNFFITEYVKQHQYAKELYEFTVNTIRIITIQDPHQNMVILPIAVQRIGRDASFPVDNFDRGGISVEVEIESGTLGRAASRLSFSQNAPVFFNNHPDTGTQITGISIPSWNDLKAKLIEIADYFPYIPFIAWDVVVTDSGFTVVEVNKSSGSKVYQVFGGHKNKSIGDFYRYHGIFK